MKYIVMKKDELGFEHRCYAFEDKVYEFPKFDRNNEAMFIAFQAWKDHIENELNNEYSEKYGNESHLFLERQYSDMSLSEWHALGYGS